MTNSNSEATALVTTDELRNCMSLFATGVTVVTTFDQDGQLHGMSANSFTSVCLDPPLVLICVAHSANTYRYLEEGRSFGVNILSAEQEAMGRYFARSPENRKGDVSYGWSPSSECGVPELEGAMAFLGCQVESSHVHGDHTIYVASVKEIHSGDAASPLLFFQHKWYTNIDANG